MRYSHPMGEYGQSTAMRRYECDQCEMTATVVDTRASRDAWRYHMDNHDQPLGFRVWTWSVVPLNFGPDD